MAVFKQAVLQPIDVSTIERLDRFRVVQIKITVVRDTER